MSRTTVSDGWNYLRLPTPITNVPFSMGCWVYIPSSPSANRPLMSIGDSSGGDHYTMFIDADDNTLRSWRMYNFGTADYSLGDYDGMLTYGKWHHILMSVAAIDDLQLYTDGVPGQYDQSSTAIQNWNYIEVGAGVGYSSYYLDAWFADVSWWDAALSGSDAIALGEKRHSGQSVRPQSLVSYAPFVLDEDYDYVAGTKWELSGTYASSIGVGSNPPGIIYPKPRHRVIPGMPGTAPMLRAR